MHIDTEVLIQFQMSVRHYSRLEVQNQSVRGGLGEFRKAPGRRVRTHIECQSLGRVQRHTWRGHNVPSLDSAGRKAWREPMFRLQNG